LRGKSTWHYLHELTFREYVLMRDGLLPPYRIAVPTTKINPLPETQARLKSSATKSVRALNPFQPAIQKVVEMVPDKFVRMVKPA
jgi:hypothetical protein